MNTKLDSRSRAILNLLLHYEGFLCIDYIAFHSKVTTRSIFADLKKINAFLLDNNIDKIKIQRGKGYKLLTEQKKEIQKIIKQTDSQIEYFTLTQQQRVSIIISFVMYCKKTVNIEKICELLDVSRNSVFADLMVVKQQLLLYDCIFEYNSQTGYTVVGSERKIRALFVYHFSLILNFLHNGQFSLYKFKETFCNVKVEENYYKFKEIMKYLALEPNEDTIQLLATIVELANSPKNFEVFLRKDVKRLENTKEYEIISYYFLNLPKHEKCYFAAFLLSCNNQSINLFMTEEDLDNIQKNASAMVTYFSTLSAIVFSQETQIRLTNQIANHLSTSMFRYIYGLDTTNLLLQNIMKEYPSVFQITKMVCEMLQERLHVPISDGEVGYITLIFATYLHNKKIYTNHVKVAIVCLNGNSTSYMLKTEVENVSDHIKISGIYTLKQVQDEKINADVIISTIDFPSEIKVIKVNPVLSKQDRTMILKHLFTNHPFELHRQNCIREALSTYLNDSDCEKATLEVLSALSYNTNQYEPLSNHEQLDSFFSKNRIVEKRSVHNWKEAIVLAAKPLLAEGVILDSYIQEMINIITVHGPYMTIAEHIILAHANPDSGVNNIGLSLLLLEEPTTIAEKKIDIFFIIVPKDSTSHLKIIKFLMTLFSKPEYLAEIKKKQSKEALFTFFSRVYMESILFHK